MLFDYGVVYLCFPLFMFITLNSRFNGFYENIWKPRKLYLLNYTMYYLFRALDIDEIRNYFSSVQLFRH